MGPFFDLGVTPAWVTVTSYLKVTLNFGEGPSLTLFLFTCFCFSKVRPEPATLVTLPFWRYSNRLPCQAYQDQIAKVTGP